MNRRFAALAIGSLALALLTNPARAETIVQEDIATDTTWTSDGSPYIVVSPVTISPLATLTLTAGVEVRFRYQAFFRVSGGLVARGTAAQPILITRDDPRGWNGIAFLTNRYRPSSFEYCTIEYGGSSFANLIIYPALPLVVIRHCILRNGFSGVRLINNASAIIEYNTITNNTYGIIAGSHIQGLGRIRHNNIAGNTAYGLSGSGSDIRLNWWGHPSGPGGAGGGSGDRITDSDVLFDPWLETPFTEPFHWNDSFNSPDPFTQSGGSTTFFGTLPEPGDWTVTLRNSVNEIVKTFTGAGTALAQRWDGTDQGGKPLPNGTYSFHLEAISTVTGQTAAPARGRVTLDNTLLLANITSPIPDQIISHGATVPVQGTAAGANFQSYRLEAGARLNPFTWFLIAQSNTPVTDGLLGNWNTLVTVPQTGWVTLRLTVFSTTGRTETLVPVRVMDTTLPRAIITAPSEDQVFLTDDPIVFRGTADDENFYDYRLEYSAGEDFVELVRSQTPVTNGILYTLDFQDLRMNRGLRFPAGDYIFRLTVRDQADNISQFDRRVTLNHIEINDVSVAPTVVDPHAKESVNIRFTLYSGADVTVKIYSFPGHQMTRTFTFPDSPAGKHELPWDGRNSAGAVAPLGTYYFTIEAAAPGGRRGASNRPNLPVLGPLPVTSQHSVNATNFNPYRNDLVQIRYTLDRPTLMTLRIRLYQTFQFIRTLADRAPQLPGPHSETWDGRNDAGRFQADRFDVPLPGPERLPWNTIFLHRPPVEFSDFRAEAYVLQPVFREVSAFVYTLNRDANITIAITDPNGNAVRTLLSNVPQQAGPQRIEWNGYTDSGTQVSVEGDYTITLTAVDPVSGVSYRRIGTIVVYGVRQ